MTEESIRRFIAHLRALERASATCQRYERILFGLLAWLRGRTVTRELLAQYKLHLLTVRGYRPSTVNVCVAAINDWLRLEGRGECCVARVRVQQPAFRLGQRELTRQEYMRLVQAARRRVDQRPYLILITLASAGIRVSELRHITLESARNGQAALYNKGKGRIILLPPELCQRIEAYARARGIGSGSVFLTARGRPLARQAIWRMLKGLAAAAGVEAQKVFPHNLRHLFAVAFMERHGDLGTLASLLGHQDINTTRVYIRLSAAQVRAQLSALCLAV